MYCDIEILCLGNELLKGMVINTNAQWLAEKITHLSGEVKRITIVGDDVKTIAFEILEAINRKPDYIITTGGLGPTYDDLTLEGVASALQLQLSINQEAEEIVREKYAKHLNIPSSEINLKPAQLKMATLPEGFKPLYNPIGTAPGVIGKKGETSIVSLPGVPSEMKSIFNESLSSRIRSSARKRFYNEINLKVEGIIESELSPLINEVREINSEVYIKSRPFIGGETPIINLHFSTTSNTNSEGLELLNKSSTKIKQLLTEYGTVTFEEHIQNPDSPSSHQDQI